MQVATVAIGDYCAGAAALINSLASAGFAGRIIVGHQGTLAWDVKSSAPITCVELPGASDKHPMTLKSDFLQTIGSGDILFIDADCVVTSLKLLDIVSEFLHVGGVFSVEGMLPASDVRHHAWRQTIDPAARYLGNFASCVPYINSGLFGLRMPRDAHYLQAWSEVMLRALPGSGDFFSSPYFPLSDQDCLNAVVANCGEPFVTLGPPDIWFRGVKSAYFQIGLSNEPLLLHGTGRQKPWRLKKPPLSRPDIYDKAFYRFAYLETPWVASGRPLPKRVIRWMEDDALSKASMKLRRFGARLSHIVRTLVPVG